jgi:hypothetical protein
MAAEPVVIEMMIRRELIRPPTGVRRGLAGAMTVLINVREITNVLLADDWYGVADRSFEVGQLECASRYSAA